MSVLAVRKALWGKINGASSVTSLLGDPAPNFSESIYDGVALDGAEFPYVVISLVSGVDNFTFAERAWEDDIWLIKAVDRSAFSNGADDIAAALKTLLTDATLTISGASLMSLRPESSVRFPEVTDGITYWHSGHRYRLSYQ